MKLEETDDDVRGVRSQIFSNISEEMCRTKSDISPDGNARTHGI